MRGPSRSIVILATLVFALAACGGSAGATTGTSGSSSGAGQSQAPAAEPTQAVGEASASTTSEAAASASTATEVPAGGGGGVADVCALVTSDELAGIFGNAVTTEVFPGPPDTCQVGTTDGAGLAAFVLTPDMGGGTASLVFDSYAGAPTATQISGIGEKAAYDPSQGALVVLKNGAVLSVAVFDDGSGSTDEATRLDQMKQIASVAAGRM